MKRIQVVKQGNFMSLLHLKPRAGDIKKIDDSARNLFISRYRRKYLMERSLSGDAK